MSRNEEIGVFRVPVGATRSAVISGLNITYIWLVPVLGVPTAFVIVTQNILWLVSMAPILWFARKSNSDPGLPRVLWLWFSSGSALADRSNPRGVEIVSASRPADDWEASLNG